MFQKKNISKILSAVGLVLMLSLLLTGIGSGASAPQVSAAPQNQDGVGEIQSDTASVAAPARFAPAYSDTPPVISAERLAASQAEDARIQQAWKARTEANPDHPVAGPSGGETGGPGSIKPQAAGDFTIFQKTTLAPTTGSSSVNEPSHATSGKDVFYTGNWYAARSTNGGATFAYIDPYADFPNFCCDQDVILDPARNAMFWYRQGVYVSSTGQNKFKLGVSTDGGASFCTYDFLPTNVNGAWTTQWFDYPHLEVSNDYLYITTNMFNGGGSFLRMLLMKMPLGPLTSCGAFSYDYWSATTGWSWTPVEGATTRMYLGDTYNSAGTFRVYYNDEGSSTLSFIDRTIPAWTFTNGNGDCPVPNGWDPCDRADQRITNGWVRDSLGSGEVGFFWNVAQGGGFAYPYIESATFNESDLSYLGRPYIWWSDFAWQYGSAAPNIHGDLGIGLVLAGGGYYPMFCVGIDDDFNGAPPGWEVNCPVTSTNWNQNKMGDYNRVRAFRPEGTFWTASGYNGVTSGAGVSYNPKYVVFGRGRDQRAWDRWKTK